MRIIAGKAGSQRLEVPPSLTRPTTDRVREAIFSSLGDRVIGANVLDLFAGSGSLGIEALSRGSHSAHFVDKNREAESSIRSNLAKSQLEGAEVFRRDILAFLATIPPKKFDLIFADPPYARDETSKELLDRFLCHTQLPASLTAEGILVLESFASSPLPELEHWNEAKEKIYGKTRVSYLTPKF